MGFGGGRDGRGEAEMRKGRRGENESREGDDCG